jgi:hypothetical protein
MSAQAQAVYQQLCQCLSADPAVQRPAEAQLLAWEAQPGFVSALLVRRGEGRGGALEHAPIHWDRALVWPPASVH